MKLEDWEVSLEALLVPDPLWPLLLPVTLLTSEAADLVRLLLQRSGLV